MSLEIFTLTGTSDFSDHVVTYSFTEVAKLKDFAKHAYGLTDAHLVELKRKGVTKLERKGSAEETWRLQTTRLNARGVGPGNCVDGYED